MAVYFIEAKKVLPLNNKNKVFIGPFDRKTHALTELEKAKKKVRYEILLNPDMLPKSPDSVVMQIVPRTSAIRAGMKESIEYIPTNIEEFVRVEEPAEEEPQVVKENPLIVSRFDSTRAWLKKNGITGEVVERANPALVRGRIVIGQVPYRLGAMAKEVQVVDLPRLSQDMLNRPLSVEDMDKAGANLQEYKIIRLTPEWRKIFAFMENADNFDEVLALTIK